MEPYRAASSARDFRDYRGPQEVKNLSAISGYFAGDCVANWWHFTEGRPRNFTQNTGPINGGPNALSYSRPSEFRFQT